MSASAPLEPKDLPGDALWISFLEEPVQSADQVRELPALLGSKDNPPVLRMLSGKDHEIPHIEVKIERP